MSICYNKMVPKWMFRWIACELLCLVVVNGKGYKPVNGKGCLNYIDMDLKSMYGREGGKYTVEQCAAAVKRLDGNEGCKGKYFFFETHGYCNCPTDDCTTSPNLRAGSAGQLYEFDPYTQASTTKLHGRKQYPYTCPGCNNRLCTCGTYLGYDKHQCCSGAVDASQCSDSVSNDCRACQDCHPVSTSTKCSVKMDTNQDSFVLAKNFAIRFEGNQAIITGSVTGFRFTWDPTYCPNCIRQVFLEVYDSATASYIAVKQIRCTTPDSPDLGFEHFTARVNIARSVFEDHDIELRVSTTLNYCYTFRGTFSPQHGWGDFRGRLAFIHCEGVWSALDATGCSTACGARAGSGTPGKVVCSKGDDAGCDLRTKPQPKRCKATPACMPVCNMNDLLSLAGTHFQCTLALLGVQNPCSCLCTFAESDIREFRSCAFGDSHLNLHSQWQACKAHNPSCGKGDTVVVHGRYLRQR